MTARQHGYVTRTRLIRGGLGKDAIDYRLGTGDLVRVHEGVYAVGHAERTALALAHAAVLACGEEAALRMDSALALWGLWRWPVTPEVSAPIRRSRPGIRTFRSSDLGRDLTVNYGIRVTTVVRTIIDVAPRRTDRQLVRLINTARLEHRLKPTALEELLARCPRAHTLIEPHQNPTRSGFEDDFVEWIRRHDLPMPAINQRSGSTEADRLRTILAARDARA